MSEKMQPNSQSVEMFTDGEVPARDEAISTIQDKISELRDRRDKINERPGFKFSNGQYEKDSELRSIDAQLSPIEELWASCGGEEIDAAEELISKLNFNSPAEDRVYHKKSLQEAKDTFYKRLKEEMYQDEEGDESDEIITNSDLTSQDHGHGLEGIDRQQKEEHAARGRHYKDRADKKRRELGWTQNEDGSWNIPENPDLEKEERIKRVREASENIKDHGLEGIDRQQKEEHAARGRHYKDRADKKRRELGWTQNEDGSWNIPENPDPNPTTPENPDPNPTTPENPDPNPTTPETKEKKKWGKRMLGAVLGAGALAVGVYIGNKTGVQINSPRGIQEQLTAGGDGFSLLGRVSARLENAFQSATGIGGKWSLSEAIRALNPFGKGGASYMMEALENSTPDAKRKWMSGVARITEAREKFRGGGHKADFDTAFRGMHAWFESQKEAAIKGFNGYLSSK